MGIDKSYIRPKNIIEQYQNSIEEFSKEWSKDYEKLNNYFSSINIKSSCDKDVIQPYFKDWSNMEGFANLLVRPKNNIECAIIFKICYKCNILLTISAGKTNLTGSATPNGGIVLSTSLLIHPDIEIDLKNKQALCPVGIPLEVFRNRVLDFSSNSLYYPADPTSRNDAYVGGTLSTNASGFVPGERGATRYWVKAIEFILPNGDMIQAERGQYISNNGFFTLDYDNEVLELPIPTYDRPKIKNASGIFSEKNGIVDFLDLVIGSEGILGLITSCKLGLARNPKNTLELFISLKSESEAIDLHDYLTNYFDNDLSQITAMEYFGYNSQNYMKHKEFLFSNDSDVGIYFQIPVFENTIDSKVEEWVEIFQSFNSNIDIDKIIVLNDPNNWKKFFEARHSIPDNALSKTKKIGGISIITDTIVPTNNFRIYLKEVHAIIRKSKIEYLLFGHLGDCHLHFHLIPNKEQEKKCLEIYDYLIDLSAKLGGVYSAEHGTGKRKRNDFRKCYGDKAVSMVQRLKGSIDPNYYLNRGNLIKERIVI